MEKTTNSFARHAIGHVRIKFGEDSHAPPRVLLANRGDGFFYLQRSVRQQNSKNRLFGERDVTNNHIISKYSKLAQKEYNSRHDWVVKVIHWELCKKLKFDLTNKWYMKDPEFVL